jgi:hypothetical protein
MTQGALAQHIRPLLQSCNTAANIKLQLDIVSFFDIDFERPAEVLADQCAGCASRLDRRRDIDS